MERFAFRTLDSIGLIGLGLGVFFLPLIEIASFKFAAAIGILVVLVVFMFRRKTEAVVVILLCLSFHAQWGIANFVLQDDLNLRLLGETELSTEKVGVAKFGPDKTLRAYGPYKHSNSFSGVMFVSLVILMLAISRNLLKLSEKYLLYVFVLAVLVSFSRSALISVILLLLIVLTCRRVMADRTNFMTLLIVTVLVFTPFYIDRFSDPLDVGGSERLSGYSWSFQVIADNGLWKGVGFGKYKEVLESQLINNAIDYNTWQIDYVHSIPLLFAATLGLIPALLLGIVLFVLLAIYASRFKLILVLSTVPLLLFDHYFLTQVSPLVYLMLLITI